MSDAIAPFVKWAGGKRRLVPFLAQQLPLPADRIVEPFVGGAALSLAVAHRVQSLWLNDVNDDLINLYDLLRRDAETFIVAARALFRPETNRAEVYYELRERFNRTADCLEKGVLFLYLNRHGYNGLCRYNRSGQFNVPYGRYKRPYFPEKELRSAAQRLQRATLTRIDFENVLAECGEGDVVYCDPPYVPLSATASFTDYATGGFDMADQERLVEAAEAASQRGAFVAISNHDTEVTRDLYQNARTTYRAVRRTISRDGHNRGKVMEVLAVFDPTGPKSVSL